MTMVKKVNGDIWVSVLAASVTLKVPTFSKIVNICAGVNRRQVVKCIYIYLKLPHL